MSQGQTFNLPNYVAPLFEVAKTSGKFLAAIGGLNNSSFRRVRDVAFGISTYDLNKDDTGTITDANAANQEGQNAPTATSFPRSGVQNVVEIFHRSVDVSYTKQATSEQIAMYADAQGTGNDYPASGANAVNLELDWQITQHLRKLARQINNQFINGSYAFPTDNATPRRTRGLLASITTNVVAADAGEGAADDLSQAYMESLVKSIFDNGGLEDENSAVILCNSAQKIRLDRIYGKAPESVIVGGVQIEKIYTPLGSFGIMVERTMPQDELVIASMDVIKPAALEVPGKGILFEEPLAKTGASDKSQIYGELGLDHGPEQYHGKLTNLKTTVPS